MEHNMMNQIKSQKYDNLKGIKREWLPALMNCIEEIYILNEETKEIVWSSEHRTGELCYHAFFGRTDPCPFCPKLKENELYIWDYYDRSGSRWLKIKNFKFRDGGRLLRAGNFNRMDDAMNLNHDSIEEISLLQKLLDENKNIKNELEYEAKHDRMTGLFNRNCFNMDIASGMYDQANIGVLYFDLNNLKSVNDTYRHEAGDRLICRLAETISRLSDERQPSVCYRIGGDEFVLILQECSKEKLEQSISLFQTSIHEAELEVPPCLVSVGSAYSSDPCDAEKLISEADQSMYQCKRRMKSN